MNYLQKNTIKSILLISISGIFFVSCGNKETKTRDSIIIPKVTTTKNIESIQKDLSTSSSIVSEIKVIDNSIPKIFLNGKEFNAVVAQTYNQDLKYDSNFVTELKQTIDNEKATGANLLLFHLWWDDLDKSSSRPNNLGDNLNLTYIDQVMDYANQKDMKIMLLMGMHTMIPEWWKKEQKFPKDSVCIPKENEKNQTCIPKELCSLNEKNCCSQETKDLFCCDIAKSEADFTTNPPTPPKPINNVTDDISIFKCNNTHDGVNYNITCPNCETDNYGWKYNNPSMGYDKAREDYGQYLTTVINHFKNHPALLGWQMQLGFSGEDYYGPNGILYQEFGYNSDQGPGLLLGKVTDYSEVFRDSFKIWLTEKYKTTTAMQSSWGDKNSSLENFKIPMASDFMVKQGIPVHLPDEGDLNFYVKLDDLTQKGKDFYEFRKYMKTKDSKYYSNLFKTLDPNHILFFNAYDNFNEYEDKNINGYILNNRMNAKIEGQNYIQQLFYSILASKYGQLGLPAWENAGSVGEKIEDKTQLDLMEESGKAMKCFGFGIGYVAALPSTIGTMPNWESDNAKKVIKNIIAYTPESDCKCKIINNPLTWKGKTMKQLLEIYNIKDFDNCKNSSNGNINITPVPVQGNTEPSNQGKCGDGICDSVEKSSGGKCPKDCR